MTEQALFRIEPTLAGRRRECAAFSRSTLTNSLLIYSICICLAVGCVFLSKQELARKTTVGGAAELVQGELKLYPNARRSVALVQVSEGELVRKGQLLAVLHSLDHPKPDAKTGKPEGTLSVLLSSLAQERNNLEAMRSAAREEAATKRAMLRRQINGLKLSTKSQRAEATASTALHDIANEQLERGRELHEQGHLSLSQFEELQRRFTETQRELARNNRDALALKEQQRSLHHKLDLVDQNLPNRLRELDSRLAANERDYARQEQSLEQRLLAPADGLITGVLSHPGATVAPHQPLMTMVRNGTGFRARLWAGSNAAGELASGQEVRLMLDAFPHQKHGMLGGTIQHINESPLTLEELGTPWEGSGAVYGITVALDISSPLYARLKPGMNLTADIKLDDSLLLHRLFEPLIQAWQRTR